MAPSTVVMLCCVFFLWTVDSFQQDWITNFWTSPSLMDLQEIISVIISSTNPLSNPSHLPRLCSPSPRLRVVVFFFSLLAWDSPRNGRSVVKKWRALPHALSTLGTGRGNAGMFCLCRQYKPSLRVCYFLEKLFIDFLIFCLRKLEIKQSRFAREGMQTSTLPPLLCR